MISLLPAGMSPEIVTVDACDVKVGDRILARSEVCNIWFAGHHWFYECTNGNMVARLPNETVQVIRQRQVTLGELR